MSKRDALKLVPGDQVVRKSDRALIQVTAVRERGAVVWIEGRNPASGAMALLHHKSAA